MKEQPPWPTLFLEQDLEANAFPGGTPEDNVSPVCVKNQHMLGTTVLDVLAVRRTT